jgi:hypothetical protein
MEYFETLGPDGRVYIHYDRWQEWRADKMRRYPRPHWKLRFDIEIANPRDRIQDVPVWHPNTHSWAGFDPHVCFYECDLWSTIYGVYDAHLYQTGGPSYRMLIESGNDDPIWGEPITLFSTSSCIENEPWGRNPANKFAFFRGKFWQIYHSEFLLDWHDSRGTVGITNRHGTMARPRPYTHDPEYMRLPFTHEFTRFTIPRFVNPPRFTMTLEELFGFYMPPYKRPEGWNLDWSRYGF